MRVRTSPFALVAVFLPLVLIEGGVRLVASNYIEGWISFAGWL